MSNGQIGFTNNEIANRAFDEFEDVYLNLTEVQHNAKYGYSLAHVLVCRLKQTFLHMWLVNRYDVKVVLKLDWGIALGRSPFQWKVPLSEQEKKELRDYLNSMRMIDWETFNWNSVRPTDYISIAPTNKGNIPNRQYAILMFDYLDDKKTTEELLEGLGVKTKQTIKIHFNKIAKLAYEQIGALCAAGYCDLPPHYDELWEQDKDSAYLQYFKRDRVYWREVFDLLLDLDFHYLPRSRFI